MCSIRKGAEKPTRPPLVQSAPNTCASLETWTGNPSGRPSAESLIAQTCGFSLPREVKASQCPSGDQRGFLSAAGLVVTRMAPPPEAGATKMSVLPFCAAL